jgi:uncharacterized protein (TIGR02996 family)
VTTEDAFLHDILSAPDNDDLRLIFADWLEDHGNPDRAEFIRVQIELARLTPDDPLSAALTEREADLLVDHGDRWRAPLRDLGVTRAVFRRGFVEVIFLEEGPVAQLRALFAAAPIRELRIRSINAAGVAEVTRMPELGRLELLSVGSTRRIGLDGARALGECPHLANLTTLVISQGAIETEGVRAIVSSPHLRSLTKLSFRCCDLTDESAALLAESALVPRLQSLDLGWNYFRPAGVRTILASPCTRLERLDLDDNTFNGPEIARTVAEATHLRLTRLNLGEARIGPEGMAALASAPHLASLRTLVVQNCALGDEGLRTLATSPYLAGLNELWLCHNSVTAIGIAALGEAPFWSGLRHLNLNDRTLTDEAMAALRDAPALTYLSLWYAPITPDGLAALTEKSFPSLETLSLDCLPQLGDAGLGRLLAGPGLPRLKRLSLHGLGLTAAAATILAGSPGLARLTSLSLLDERIGNEGACALALSPYVAGLRDLSLCGCGIADEGAEALARSPYLERLHDLALYRNAITPDGAGQSLRERFGDRVRLT